MKDFLLRPFQMIARQQTIEKSAAIAMQIYEQFEGRDEHDNSRGLSKTG